MMEGSGVVVVRAGGPTLAHVLLLSVMALQVSVDK
jgi:hypothetical protein